MFGKDNIPVCMKLDSATWSQQNCIIYDNKLTKILNKHCLGKVQLSLRTCLINCMWMNWMAKGSKYSLLQFPWENTTGATVAGPKTNSGHYCHMGSIPCWESLKVYLCEENHLLCLLFTVLTLCNCQTSKKEKGEIPKDYIFDQLNLFKLIKAKRWRCQIPEIMT